MPPTFQDRKYRKRSRPTGRTNRAAPTRPARRRSPLVGRDLEHCTNKAPAAAPVTSAPIGCITSEPAQIATNPASAPLCTKPGSLPPRHERRKDAAAHRHQRIHRDETGEGFEILRAYNVEAEPADAQQPRTHRQPRDRRWRRTDRAAAIVASDTGPSCSIAANAAQPPKA